MNDPKPNPARLWILLSLGFLACFAALRYASKSEVVGKPADYSWKVTDLEGQPVELSSYRDKAVFLNVWATWCPPCVKEMPSIARLAANPRLKEVAFLCVSVDEAREDVLRFFEGKTPPMTILHAVGPPPQVFRANDGIPATFILAPGGRIVTSEVGSREWDVPEVIDQLEGLSR